MAHLHILVCTKKNNKTKMSAPDSCCTVRNVLFIIHAWYQILALVASLFIVGLVDWYPSSFYVEHDDSQFSLVVLLYMIQMLLLILLHVAARQRANCVNSRKMYNLCAFGSFCLLGCLESFATLTLGFVCFSNMISEPKESGKLTAPPVLTIITGCS